MDIFDVKFRILTIFASLSLIIGIIIFNLITPLYEISGSATIIRSNLPPVTTHTPESRNRWVWARDGLSIKELLKQDDLFINFAKKDGMFKDRYISYVESKSGIADENSLISFIHDFKKNIDIQYTGADSNVFIFTVLDKNPILAQNIVNWLIDNLKSIHSGLMTDRYDQYLSEIADRLITSVHYKNSAINGPERLILNNSLSELLNAYGKLYTESVLQNAEKVRQFKILERPFIPEVAIWPNFKLIIFTSLLAGIAAGFLSIYIFSSSFAKDE